MKNNQAVWITTALIVAGWEWLTGVLSVPAFILPPPSGIAVALWEQKELLFMVHLPATMVEVLFGLVLSVILGVLVAVLVHFTRIGEQVIYPMVIASQAIPLIALSPILIMWFGYSIWGKVAVTVFISFFPIVVGSVDGLRATNQEWVQLMKTMGATNWQIFTKLQIRQGLPAFFSGLKVAATVSVVGATIGEWLGASEGLGFFSRRASNNLQADLLFASVFLLSVAGFLLFLGIQWLEKKIIPWHEQGKNTKKR